MVLAQLIRTPQVLKALERNFNGIAREEFRHIVHVFLERMQLPLPNPRSYRTPLRVGLGYCVLGECGACRLLCLGVAPDVAGGMCRY